MKKWLAGLLAILLVLSVFAGCGDKPSSSAPQAEGSKPEDKPQSTTQQEEEPYLVRVMNIHSAKTEDCEEVAAYINTLTKDIGVEVEIIGDMTSEQINLALTSGEKMDLFSAFPWVASITNLVSNGQVLPLNDLLDAQGKDIRDSISEADWRCVTFGGQIYGVPVNNDKAQSRALQMRKEYVDQLGIDYENIKTMDDVEAVLRTVKEKLPDVYPLVSAGGDIGCILPIDSLSDDLGVLEDVTKDDTTVVNLYETKSFEEYANRMHRWYQDGLIMPDATSNTSSIEQLLGAGTGFAGLVPSKPGAVLQASREAGAELVQSQLVAPISVTGMVATPFCIAASCENPEKAMELLNLMYTDHDVSNAFIYGLEGKHYEYVDREHDVLDYPEGITTENTGYSVLGWSWPNQQVGSIWNGDDYDVWEQLAAFNANATASPAKGFVWDNSKVLNEVTACQNVISQYRAGLQCGMLDPAETLPKMNQELKDAGIDTIIQEKQSQLDAWLAAQ